jgi:hypothetical protein
MEVEHRIVRHLVTIGAFITILAAAVDPFTQGVLDFYSCLRPVEDTVSSLAMVPVTNSYSGGSYYTNGGSKVADSAMTAAFYMGLVCESY